MRNSIATFLSSWWNSLGAHLHLQTTLASAKAEIDAAAEAAEPLNHPPLGFQRDTLAARLPSILVGDCLVESRVQFRGCCERIASLSVAWLADEGLSQ